MSVLYYKRTPLYYQMASQLTRTVKVLMNTYSRQYIVQLQKDINTRKQYLEALAKDPNHPKEPLQINLIFVMDDKTVKIKDDYFYVWYGLIFNLDGPLQGGEFIIELNIPDTYPAAPPRFKLLTENGCYDVNEYPCVSNGHMHKEDYNPSLGIIGFTKQVAFAMTSFNAIQGPGMHIMHTTDNEKRTYARNSNAYNQQHNKYILDKFKDHIEQFDIASIYNFRFLEYTVSSTDIANIANMSLE